MRCFFVVAHETRTTSTPQNTVDYKSIVVIQDVREPSLQRLRLITQLSHYNRHYYE